MKRRKLLVVVILVLAILLQCVAPLCQVANAATGTSITLNAKLYEAVKAALINAKQASFSYSDSTYTITITDSELAKVTYLDLSESEISDLTGLSAFTSVTYLDLSGNDLTVDSNLGEIDSLALASSSVQGTLDLSSNKLESVKSITSFSNIYYTDIENQEVTSAEVIEAVDQWTYTVTLPDILLEDTGYLVANWFTESETVTGSCSIDWNSVSGNTVKIKIASGSGENYTAYEGLIKIVVDVDEKTNPNSALVNTHMTLYYCVVGEDSTGIVFKDSNLYYAIKAQLTAGQVTNDELDSYGSNGTTLYKKAYDEALILVIDDNVLLNDITSLILNDIQVTDLTGLEKFIGLDSELNLSYNYIDSIERILELEENKEAAEAELQAKYSEALSLLSSDRSTLMSYIEQLETLEEELEKLEEELAELQSAENPSESSIESKQEAIEDKQDEIGVCEKNVSKYTAYVEEDMEKLYDIYHKEYLLTTILTADTLTLTNVDLAFASEDELKSWASSIASKISTLEQNDALTSWEAELIINELGISTTTTSTRTDEDGNEYTEEVAIENPITEYFSDMERTITNYYSFVYNMKILDAIITAANYCVYAQAYGGETECQLISSYDDGTLTLGEAFDVYIDNLDSLGLSTYFASIAESNLGSYTTTCMCEEDISIVTLSGKLVNNSDLVSTLIKIPRLKYLDLTDNSLTSIAGIENLSQLETLLLYKNLLGTGDISEVDWSSMTSLLVLDLGYNQLTFDDIECLESIPNLEYLYLTKNLLSGSFDFNLTALSNLAYADFSYNQISDITAYINAYQFKALNVGMEIEEYLLSSYAPTVLFQYQTLTITTTLSQTDSNFVTVELPYIFRQAEDIDYTRTSFGIQSLYGTVEANGETATLYTGSLGTYTAVVTIEGWSGGITDSSGDTSVYSTDGIAYGTVCTIKYTVVEESDDTVDVVVDSSTIDNATLEVTVSESGTLLYTFTGADLSSRGLTFDWTISGNTSSSTTIVDQGENLDSDSKMTEYAVLTIGDDETADTITVTVTTSEGAVTTLDVKIIYNTDDDTDDDTENVEDTNDTDSTGTVETTDDTDDSSTDTTEDVTMWEATDDEGTYFTVEAGSTQGIQFTYESADITEDMTAEWSISGNTSSDTTVTLYEDDETVITVGEKLVTKAILSIGEDEDADTMIVTVTLSNGDYREITFTKVDSSSSDSEDTTDTTTDTDTTTSTDDSNSTTDTSNTTNSDTTDETSVGTSVSTIITYGYTVSDDLVYVTTPGISVEDFEESLVTAEGYVVSVSNSEDSYDESVLATSAVVTISTEDGTIVTNLEVVVLGDVNGDGKVNALDSGLIRNVINGVAGISGSSYEAAADVDLNGTIDKADSVLVLQYRANKITSF